MKQFFNRYKILLSALLIAVVCVGGTLAYLVATDNPVTNTFSLADVHTTIVEGDEGTEESKVVSVSNTGKSDAFVRARVVVSAGVSKVTYVKSKADVPAFESRDADTIYVVINTADWVKDGTADSDYYYYQSLLPAKGSTSALVNGVFCGKNIDADSFDVVVYAESVLGSGSFNLASVKADFDAVS